jgi:hypothetical protein
MDSELDLPSQQLWLICQKMAPHPSFYHTTNTNIMIMARDGGSGQCQCYWWTRNIQWQHEDNVLHQSIDFLVFFVPKKETIQ